MSYIAVIGAGSWGTTLSRLLAGKGYDVSLWVYERDLCEEIRSARVNSLYLPGFHIPDNVVITDDIREAVHKARYVLNVVPTQFARSIIGEAIQHIDSESVIVNAAKGIERKTLLTVSRIIKGLSKHVVAVLSGPSFAEEVARELPTAVTLACDNPPTALLLQEIFNTHYFRVYTHDDVLGVELGGALKNVIAIASGICDGLLLGHNSRAALLTRALVEIKRLGAAMGARELTFSGLSGLGDLILTCTGSLSRNYTLGTKLASGMKLNDILSQSKSVVEGVATAESAYELAQRYNVQMPFVEQVYKLLYEGKDPAVALRELMNRTLKTEFDA